MTLFSWKSLALLATAAVTCAQLPAEVTDLQEISREAGGAIRYKQTEICETTEGVKAFSGYIDVADDKHFFFWFFESRSNPLEDPITLWFNGGPGGDGLSGLFDGQVNTFCSWCAADDYRTGPLYG
jgi:carboxypeptidase C (cathepsin A)